MCFILLESCLSKQSQVPWQYYSNLDPQLPCLWAQTDLPACLAANPSGLAGYQLPAHFGSGQLPNNVPCFACVPQNSTTTTGLGWISARQDSQEWFQLTLPQEEARQIMLCTFSMKLWEQENTSVTLDRKQDSRWFTSQIAWGPPWNCWRLHRRSWGHERTILQPSVSLQKSWLLK